MAFERSSLPSMQRFQAGLITNRNPLDTPFSLQGLNTIEHHDVLNDGLNVELSAYDTIQRRPGWVPFISGAAIDTWQYKDLNGAISLFVDSGTSLLRNSSLVKTNSAGAFAWTLEGQGNFLYATNGVDLIRIPNYAPTTYVPWGIKSPLIRPVVTVSSLGLYNVVTGFIVPADQISGVVTATDGQNLRTLTITVNSGVNLVHFNVTYTGNGINPNTNYTTVQTLTVTGTAPNTTTTAVNSYANNATETVTGTGMSNGVINYYSGTGISTLDFDMAYSGTLTLAKLQAVIHAANGFTFSGSSTIPASAVTQLRVFVDASLINGIWKNPGATPISTQIGQALNLTITNVNGPAIQINSGLFDITNPQLSLIAAVGSAPRLYQHVSPAALATDLFSGTMQIQLYDNVFNPTSNYTFTNQTLAQIALQITSPNWQVSYVQTGLTGYIVIRNFISHVTQPGTQDVVLQITANTLVNQNDVNINFQNWLFLESNDYAQFPQQGVQIAYAVRDTLSGGLSNISPAVKIAPQINPCRWVVSSSAPYSAQAFGVNGYQLLELYRTSDGGSSFLFEQIMPYQSPTNTFTDFSLPDSQLNPQLIGPINETNDPPPRGLRNITTHTGRKWGTLGNKVYYSGGPDTTNGNGDEAWPPGNFFQYPGPVVDIVSLDGGLVVALGDDLHIISGVDSSSYYSKPWLNGFGISNPNAWCQDASALFLYTSKQQLHAISEGGSKEIGFDIGDIFLASFPAATTSLTFHRGSSLDTALYISNGTDTILRYNPIKRNWSPKSKPLITAGRVKSLETSLGIQSLVNATAGGVYQRSTTTFTDNGTPYSAFFTIGVIQLADSGMRKTFSNVIMQSQNVGTIAQVWILLNEINATTIPFNRLFNPVNEPADAPASASIQIKKWFVQQTLTPFPAGNQLVNLASIKVVWQAEAIKNEVLGIFLRDKT